MPTPTRERVRKAVFDHSAEGRFLVDVANKDVIWASRHDRTDVFGDSGASSFILSLQALVSSSAGRAYLQCLPNRVRRWFVAAYLHRLTAARRYSCRRFLASLPMAYRRAPSPQT